ncbi:hypothetical protein [Wolbachia endosymbiont of Ctenocephalides felis wCfeT]|uniref:hypothetical protein n=1 Tax=Wolbachia endosymbiont of Ctenocephalides felis wCfeT TaxID=2732593 RepID=UPI0014462274|nr:hypothetical protein [Wolbachia endosymbiont of Ctenocephalides felis wCfeT]
MPKISQEERPIIKKEASNVEGKKISIASKLEDIEQSRIVEFSFKGKDLTINSLSISDDYAEIGFVTGEVKHVHNTSRSGRKSTIDGIISGFKNKKIRSEKEYNYEKFNKRYLAKLWSKEVTTSQGKMGNDQPVSDNMQGDQLLAQGIEAATNITGELPDFEFINELEEDIGHLGVPLPSNVETTTLAGQRVTETTTGYSQDNGTLAAIAAAWAGTILVPVLNTTLKAVTHINNGTSTNLTLSEPTPIPAEEQGAEISAKAIASSIAGGAMLLVAGIVVAKTGIVQKVWNALWGRAGSQDAEKRIARKETDPFLPESTVNPLPKLPRAKPIDAANSAEEGAQFLLGSNGIVVNPQQESQMAGLNAAIKDLEDRSSGLPDLKESSSPRSEVDDNTITQPFRCNDPKRQTISPSRR